MNYKEIKDIIADIKNINHRDVSSQYLYIIFSEFKEFLRQCALYCANMKFRDPKVKYSNVTQINLKLASDSIMMNRDYSKEFINLIFSKVKFHYQIQLKKVRLGARKSVKNDTGFENELTGDLHSRRSENLKRNNTMNQTQNLKNFNNSNIFQTPKQSQILLSATKKPIPKSTKASNKKSISFEGELFDKNISSVKPDCFIKIHKKIEDAQGSEMVTTPHHFTASESNRVAKSPIAIFNEKVKLHSKVNSTRQLIKKKPSNNHSGWENREQATEPSGVISQMYIDKVDEEEDIKDNEYSPTDRKDGTKGPFGSACKNHKSCMISKYKKGHHNI